MSERVEGQSEQQSPADAFFERRKTEIQTEMSQAVIDAIRATGGDEALEFATTMGLVFEVNNKTVLTESLIHDLEQFYPGYYRNLSARWTPLMAEMKLMTAIARRRKDKEILAAYEEEL